MKFIYSLLLLFSFSSFGQQTQFDFDAAYMQYPEIPQGLLEAVAWTNTRMRHLENTNASCIGIPQPYGVMGLHDHGQNYFIENGKKVAKLSGISVSSQKSDPNTQILAYAGAIHALLSQNQITQPTAADIRLVLEQLSEIPDSGAVNLFAKDLQTSEVLRFMNSQEKATEFNFQAQQFDLAELYGSSNYLVLTGKKIIFTEQGISNAKGDHYTLNSFKSTEYGPAIWNPAAACNFSSRNGTAVSAITIHTVQGTYAGCISWFQNCSASVSAHYVVRSSDGQITQMVSEADKAWHVGTENPYTIGYEHEGYVDDPAWYTDEMYNASADLSRDIVNSGYGIPPLRTYYGPSSATTDLLGGCTKIKGHQHYANQTHTDPGINWDWEKYYRLINNNYTVNSLTAGSGNLYDTGGATGDYLDDEREFWLIQPANAMDITLDFTSFNIEQDWDYMFIYDGDSIDAPLIGVYTGSNTPGTVVSSGGSLLIEFRSDCSTVSSGWEASYTITLSDVTPPVTTIIAGPTWQTDDFTVDFTDTDTQSAITDRFYLVAENQLSPDDWTSNGTFGFLHETFDNNDANWFAVTGNYAINSGSYEFTDVNEQNSNAYITVDQNSGNEYLYTWDQTFVSNEINQRAGIHFFCDNPNLPNRGNSYFIYIRENDDKIQIYSVDNDLFNLEGEFNLTVDAGTTYNCKVLYNPSNGWIKVFVDDAFIGAWQDSTPLTSGSFVSLRTGGCSATFDNVEVYHSRGNTVNITAGPGEELSVESLGAVQTGMIKSLIIDDANNVSAIASEFYLLDFTAPTIDYLNDGPSTDIDTFFTTTIESNWNAIDPHSDISQYEFAIGVLPLLDNIIPWTDNGLNTSISEVLSSPVYGEVYHISVRAINNGGLSEVFISNGQRYMEGLGLIEQQLENIVVYPNPASDRIYLKGLDQQALAMIYDANGKLVLVDELSQSEINISHLADGSYNLVIRLDNSFTVKKIIIRK